MAREYLSLRPYTLNADTWLYEARCGLEIFCRSGNINTERVGVIPWSKVRAALRRHDLKPATKEE
jgi:hypothetical protein